MSRATTSRASAMLLSCLRAEERDEERDAAPHAAASGYQLQQAYGAPMAAAPYGAPPHAQAQAYDPAAAACAAAAAEWGQAAQAQQQQAMQAQQQQQAPQQTGEWQTHYSEGRAYYYNVTTGETRWA